MKEHKALVQSAGPNLVLVYESWCLPAYLLLTAFRRAASIQCPPCCSATSFCMESDRLPIDRREWLSFISDYRANYERSVYNTVQKLKKDSEEKGMRLLAIRALPHLRICLVQHSVGGLKLRLVQFTCSVVSLHFSAGCIHGSAGCSMHNRNYC